MYNRNVDSRSLNKVDNEVNKINLLILFNFEQMLLYTRLKGKCNIFSMWDTRWQIWADEATFTKMEFSRDTILVIERQKVLILFVKEILKKNDNFIYLYYTKIFDFFADFFNDHLNNTPGRTRVISKLMVFCPIILVQWFLNKG